MARNRGPAHVSKESTRGGGRVICFSTRKRNVYQSIIKEQKNAFFFWLLKVLLNSIKVVEF